MKVYYRMYKTDKKVHISKDARMFIVFVVFKEVGYKIPLKEGGYRYFKVVTSTRFFMSFKEESFGKRIYIKGFYVNNKGEEGYESEVLSTIISD